MTRVLVRPKKSATRPNTTPPIAQPTKKIERITPPYQAIRSWLGGAPEAAPGRVGGAAGDMLLAEGLESRPLVKRGEHVVILIRRSGFEIKAAGVAQMDGRLGTVIPVRREGTRRREDLIDAVVTGPIDPLLDRRDGFTILQGVNASNPCPYNGSLWMLAAGWRPDVWSQFSLEAAECPPTFGTPPSLVRAVIAGGTRALTRSVEGAEDDARAGARSMRSVRSRDAVVGISASGSAPFVLAALAQARRAGAATILISCAPSAAVADIRITPKVGPEVIAGSTRLKAGTATKLILNAITVAVMTRLGKVHENLMVDVRPTNRKLRARALRMFLSEQAWWIEDYSVFRAIHASRGEQPWLQWPPEWQRREPSAIKAIRQELARDILFYQYLQWQAWLQWARARAHTHGVQLFGDLPFMVDGDSADVWARQHQFRLDASLGAPPDAFSATGQDWAMPTYHWERVAATGQPAARRTGTSRTGFHRRTGIARPVAGQSAGTSPAATEVAALRARRHAAQTSETGD